MNRWNSFWYELLVNDCGIHTQRLDHIVSTEYDNPLFTSYTGLSGELEHLNTEMRLRDERFEGVKGECVIKSYRIVINIQIDT